MKTALAPLQIDFGDIDRDMRPSPPPQWDRLWVAFRMVEALDVLRNTRLRHDFRPDVKAFWPEFKHDFADETGLDDDQRRAKADERNRVRIQPTPREISLMQEAIHWPLQHLIAANVTLRPGEDCEQLVHMLRLALGAWLKAKAMPRASRQIRRLVEGQGWTRTTFYRRRERALDAIVAGLVKARVPCR